MFERGGLSRFVVGNKGLGWGGGRQGGVSMGVTCLDGETAYAAGALGKDCHAFLEGGGAEEEGVHCCAACCGDGGGFLVGEVGGARD